MFQLFREACGRRLKSKTMRSYIVSNWTPELLISGEAQQETYLYHAVKENLQNGNVR